MRSSSYIWIGIFIGSTVGGLIPELWGDEYSLTRQYCLVVLVRLWGCGLDLRFLIRAQIFKLGH
jgi:hypothetical protein